MTSSERVKVYEEFNYLLEPRKDEIKKLCAEILTNAIPVVYAKFQQDDLFLDRAAFENNEVTELDPLFEAVGQNAVMTAEILFGAYYYELVATDMMTMLAAKIANYIESHTGELVKFKFTGYSAKHCLRTTPTAGLVCSGGTAWDDKYYAILIHLPKRIAYVNRYIYDGGLKKILEFDLEVGFSVNDSKLFPISVNPSIPFADLGIKIREEYFDKIKEIVAKQI